MPFALEHNPPGLHLTLQADLYAPPRKADRQCNRQSTTRPNSWIYCTVSDNGEGIPSQYYPKLFDLYTSAVSTKQSLNVGLGLYISRQIITAHGGEIDVKIKQTGASFWFNLPIYNS